MISWFQTSDPTSHSISGRVQTACWSPCGSVLLFATDAFTMPEIFWLAAKWGRWGLSKVLSEFVVEGFMTEKEGEKTAVAILNGNAQKLYGLEIEE